MGKIADVKVDSKVKSDKEKKVKDKKTKSEVEVTPVKEKKEKKSKENGIDKKDKKKESKKDGESKRSSKKRSRDSDSESDGHDVNKENFPKRIQKNNVLSESEQEVEEEPEEETELSPANDPSHPGHFSHFNMSKETEQRLRSRNIHYLFPIQISTYDPIYAGKDVIGRARTGTGKTLSFALPVIERLKSEGAMQGARPRGRAPKVIVMAPTRELAKQVCADFEMIAPELSASCVYGGVPYDPQINAFKHGIDILVGTPGRILDHLNRGTLRLGDIRFVIMDEADQMLDIGFADAMETLLHAVNEQRRDGKTKQYQVLLFSATLPAWIFDVSKKYMDAQRTLIDLIGSQKMKASETVRHCMIPCLWQQRHAVLADIVQVYGGGKNGRTIIFAETKNEANEITLGNEGGHSKLRCQVIHGDIQQKQRELTLNGFREGKFNCLVATDVAARGIDIPEVDLVVQCQPPKDAETYIHRSGRTGRAGKSGVCILFYKPNEEYQVRQIERKAGTAFEKLRAPQPADIVAAAATDALLLLNRVPKTVLPSFLSIAREFLKNCPAEEALATALAVITGHGKGIAQRSLLSSQDGYTTLLMNAESEIRSHSYIWNIIKKDLTVLAIDEVQSHVKGMKLFRNGRGAAFDVPSDKVDAVMALWEEKSRFWHGIQLEVASSLPDLQEPANTFGGGSSGGYGGGRGGSGGFQRRGGYGGNRGGSRGGFRR